jgi:(p)ppGpp synthase/HD superfamily hydrolase
VNKVAAAFAIAEMVHSDQKDKAGQPYMEHIREVANIAASIKGYGSKEHIVAILHDSLEDAKEPHRVAGQIWEKFGQSILTSVMAISKRKDEDYLVFILRVRQDEVARFVKRVDLSHNMRIDRILRFRSLTEKEVEKMRLYQIADKILS